MRKVRCPRCSAITPAEGDVVKCARCGLQGRIGKSPPRADGSPPKDPFVITIDLRKANPKNWGKGAKVFAVLILLVGAFFLGGVAGVAFEKARNEISGDLEKGESLLGGGDTQANSSGEGGGPLSSPTSTTTTSPPVTAPPTSSDGNDTNETGLDPNAGGQENGGADDPPPENDNYGDGDPPAPFVFNGTGEGKTVAFTTEQDLLVLDVAYYSDGDFFTLYLCAEGSPCNKGSDAAAKILATHFGTYEHSRVFSVPAGAYFIKITSSSGDWEVTVTQPQPAEGGQATGMRFGNGDGARGPFEFDGTYTVGFGANGHGQVEVQAYMLNGTKIPGCSFSGPASGKDDPYAATRTCEAKGLVFFDIHAPKRSDTQQSWALDIEGA